METIHMLAVYGTRPEVVKLAPVIARFRESPRTDVTVLSTGQHADLAPMAERTFDLVPDRRLDAMRPGQNPAQLHALLLELLTGYLSTSSADMVVVVGDTTTTLAAAEAAHYHHLPVAHVEAGLRSYRRHAPFPEEMNRRLITSLAALHFAPTRHAARNLAAVGVEDSRVHVTGNTVLDALRQVAGDAPDDGVPEKFGVPPACRLLLATVHRRESWGEPMVGIGRALREILARFADSHLILPLHPNPVAGDALRRALADHSRAHLIDALTYDDFVPLLRSCHLVLTDSGGLQEEAPYFDKPVVVLRNETDRPEAVESGTAVLATTDPERIVAEASRLMSSDDLYQKMAQSPNPYGDGHAAERIVQGILNYFGLGDPPDPF